MIKNILYLGLNDKDLKKQIVKTRKAVKIISDLLINDYGLPGATLQVAKGIYKHNDGRVVKENTIIITLLEVENIIINKIIEELKDLFNQESIMKETCQVNVNFL